MEPLNPSSSPQRFQSLSDEISQLYHSIYANHPAGKLVFEKLLDLLKRSHEERSVLLKERDEQKLSAEPIHWFLSNELCGMSLYVDRFCGSIPALKNKLDYFEKLGVNLLHLMPLFESPTDASDGGYAVSDFRKVDQRFGTLDELKELQEEMRRRNMYLMLDIVLNHTSDQHAWAKKAKQGLKRYQEYYYFFDNRTEPDEYEKTMPEIFPQTAPGNFTYINECGKWVMTVFHQYQWDLNYSNPQVFVEMLENILFYANLGVDILRIDAPAFIWKEKGTHCQNLPKAHVLLQLIKQCVQVAAPGMALLAEAIVAPKEIMKYLGEDNRAAKECDLAYHATQMALQWDALATGDIRVMMAAQPDLLKKPFGTSWITYTRCHDDIGLGYEDEMIRTAGFNPYEHRKFLKKYYTGNFYGSPARGALFSVNEKTGDARISGSLASLCGLETAMHSMEATALDTAVKKILLMQAMSFFIGGIPMIFYGDECGYVNDYSYLADETKKYDNRWMHRPVIDWLKNERVNNSGTIEHLIFSGTKKLIGIRKHLSVIADKKNLTWLTPHNQHIAGFLRAWEQDRVYCLFNFSMHSQPLPWSIFNENGMNPATLYDYWSEKFFSVGKDDEFFVMPPYSFFVLVPK